MEKRAKERFVGGSLVMGNREEGVCTPSSSWRLVDSPQNGIVDKRLLCRNVSARKLGADLWETFPVCSSHVPKHVPHSPHQTEGATGLMSEAARSSVQLPRARPRNHFHQPKSSGTDISCAEAALYSLSDSASSLSTSIQARESTLRIGTSAGMVEVLNCMRNHGNQQISSSSHLKASSVELHDSRKGIKDLRRYDQNKQQEVEGMVEKILEGSFGRNFKSQSKSLSAVQALKSELDDERRRRKHLESLNRKLAQDIAELNISFSSNIMELEKKRRSCKAVEDLCDAFAKEILDRQSQVSSAKHCTLKEDKLTLHIAEAWLDERTRSNQHPNRFMKSVVSGKLSSEMETFEAKLSLGLKTRGDLSSSQEKRSFYRRSSESFLLNEPANQIPANEDNSSENEMNCFQQHKRSTSRRSTGSSIGTVKCSAINSLPMVKDVSRRCPAAINEHKMQTSDMRDLSTDSYSSMQQLRPKLTTSPVNQKQQSLARRLKEGSLGSHLLKARKRQHYCIPASKGSVKF